MIRQTASGVTIDIRVIPRARRSEIAGERDGAVLVRLAAPPVDGAANQALVALLADVLACPRRAVTIVSGDTARAKRIAVEGLTVEQVRQALNAKTG